MSAHSAVARPSAHSAMTIASTDGTRFVIVAGLPDAVLLLDDHLRTLALALLRHLGLLGFCLASAASRTINTGMHSRISR